MQTINLNKLDLQDQQLAIDLGCGLGRHMHAMYFHRRCTAVGLDLGHEDVTATREGFKNTPDLEPQVGAPRHYVLSVGDATQLPFSNNKFDRLICSEVLEHIPDIDDAIDEIWRIIKPGGRIGISVPRAWPEKICWLLSDDYHNEPGGHVRIFNANALRKSFEDRGFRFSQKHHAHGLHSPYWWLKCLVGVKNDQNIFVRIYHKVLVLEILQNPWYLKLLTKIMDPLMGKSVVLYFDKPE